MKMTITRCLIVFILVCTVFWCDAQKAYQCRISKQFEKISLVEIFAQIEEQCGIKFYYEPQKMPYYSLSYNFTDKSVYEVLNRILPEHGLANAAYDDHSVFVCPKYDLNKAKMTEVVNQWNNKKILLPEILRPNEQIIQIGNENSQKKQVTLKATLLDESSLEPIAGANIQVGNSTVGTSTDAQGNFTLPLSAGKHILNIRYIGYKNLILNLSIYEDGQQDIKLQQQTLALQEVVVEGMAQVKNRSTTAGIETLPIQTIKELPSFLGEADVIKSLSVLTGVSTVGEGASGFNVRGGNVDQNLILQDNVPIYNSSHVLGFFSIFNPDMVKNITLYKGHIPAQFGGRVSSVLDVKLKDGDFERWNGVAGLGTSAVKLMMNGPIVKNKTSAILGARASYSDWMLKSAALPTARESSAYFWDGTAKITHKFSKKSNLNAAFTQSSDYFRFARQFGYQWNTQLISLGYQHTVSEKFSFSFQNAYGQYKSQYFVPQETEGFEIENGLKYAQSRLQFLFIPNQKHQITAGINVNYTQSIPEKLSPAENSIYLPKNVVKGNGLESALYVEDEYKMNDFLSASMGLRFSVFQALGQQTIYQYAANQPRIWRNMTDSVVYAANEVISTYSGFEPRFSMKFTLNSSENIKLSYNKIIQYIHLISNSTSATPTDTWQLSNPHFRPEEANNFSIGYFRTQRDTKLDIAIEGYYKTVNHLPTYKNFPELLINKHLETELLDGKSKGYGAELSIKKEYSKLSASLAYTYARVFHRTLSAFEQEAVNQNNWFKADFDQPHQLSIYGKWAFTPASLFMFNFAYRTGRPITAPDGSYGVGASVVPNFSERNLFRIPNYQRLDISYLLDKSRAKISGLKWSVALSVYNLLGRKNAYSVFFKRDVDNLAPKAYQLSVIGAAIPAVSLSLAW